MRFDSAKASLGNGKFLGTVFTDFVPTLVLPLNGAGIDQEARRVDDALHHPERTFPSFLGKYVPGQQGHPLHRLMDTTQKDSNHAAAVSICVDVWGIDYATGGLECDEYPFKTTREGAYVSTQGNPGTWNGSARPISARDNGTGGVLLGNFYGSNRLLDNDAFFVTTQ